MLILSISSKDNIVPKRSTRPLTSRLPIYIFTAVSALALIALTLFVAGLHARVSTLETQGIKDALIDSVRSLNSPLAVEAQTGRQFIPALHLVLPAELESRMYSRGVGALDGNTVWLAGAENQLQAIARVRSGSTLQDTLKQVDVLQKCSRQIVLTTASSTPRESNDPLTLKATKKLKDGRTVSVYQNDCPFGAEPMLRSLDHLESY
jgi:hypothetical protein